MNFTYDDLESALARARAGVGASDLHGSVTGYLCGGGRVEGAGLVTALELDVDEGEPQRLVQDQLQVVYRDCRAALDDAQLGFEPLLPASDSPLAERADALVEWCRGFLGGFGLATAQRKQELSADGSEILRDMGTIAASELTSELSVGESEEDEHSLMEVGEFVRIGALVLHAELAGRAASRPSGTSVH